MSSSLKLLLAASLISLGGLLPSFVAAQAPNPPFVYGDALPDAPELAARGDYRVGVRTLDLVHADQPDILNAKDGVVPAYDRRLRVEVWYPAEGVGDADSLTTYDEVLGTAGNPKMPVRPFTFLGRATRDAAPLATDGGYPLVIVSHGYVGSRYLMTYLTENLASKGYVVVAIDHAESTFRDAAGFQSTLLNRSRDILFMIGAIADLAAGDDSHFLAGLADADRTALIGYSMGGYGALNAAGAGYSDGALKFFAGMTGSDALATRGGSHPGYRATVDPRIKAVVAFAPWGMERGIWNAETLKGLAVPTFFVAGSEDDISGYERGIKAIYAAATNADRYLLTYRNARHNVAPNPPPPESLAPGLDINEYYRYAEPSWDSRRINNINQHFVTAFLGVHLKDADYGKFLDLPADANAETWTGFVPRSSTGLELLFAPGE